MTGEIVSAVVTAFFIPALFAIWKRRHDAHPEPSEALLVGLFFVVAGAGAGYLMTRLPVEVADVGMDFFLLLLKIALVLVAICGILIGGITAWGAAHELSGKPK